MTGLARGGCRLLRGSESAKLRNSRFDTFLEEMYLFREGDFRLRHRILDEVGCADVGKPARVRHYAGGLGIDKRV
jgi:hypothetical protein